MREGGEREGGAARKSSEQLRSGLKGGASGLLNIVWIGCGLCPTTSASVSCVIVLTWGFLFVYFIGEVTLET